MSLLYAPFPSGPALIIGDDALKIMLAFQQLRARDTEAGGQLFARFNGTDSIIMEATPPTLLDRRTRYSFTPSRYLQRRDIKKKHAAALHFVGDWHTHPESVPTPSPTDRGDMQECFRRSTHDLTAFVMIIVGLQAPPEGLYVALVTASASQPLMYIGDGAAVSLKE